MVLIQTSQTGRTQNKARGVLPLRQLASAVTVSQPNVKLVSAITYEDAAELLYQLGVSHCGSEDQHGLVLLRSLEGLEDTLTQLAENDPIGYQQYLDLVLSLNGAPEDSMEWLNLFSTQLNTGCWDSLSAQTRESYIEHLGERLVYSLLDNPLTSVLARNQMNPRAKTKDGDALLQTGYLFSLLQLIYCFIGHAKLCPDREDTTAYRPASTTRQMYQSTICAYRARLPTITSIIGGAVDPVDNPETLSQALRLFHKTSSFLSSTMTPFPATQTPIAGIRSARLNR